MYSALIIEAALYCGTTSFVHGLTETAASKPKERKVSCVMESKTNCSWKSLLWFFCHIGIATAPAFALSKIPDYLLIIHLLCRLMLKKKKKKKSCLTTISTRFPQDLLERVWGERTEVLRGTQQKEDWHRVCRGSVTSSLVKSDLISATLMLFWIEIWQSIWPWMGDGKVGSGPKSTSTSIKHAV